MEINAFVKVVRGFISYLFLLYEITFDKCMCKYHEYIWVLGNLMFAHWYAVSFNWMRCDNQLTY